MSDSEPQSQAAREMDAAASRGYPRQTSVQHDEIHDAMVEKIKAETHEAKMKAKFYEKAHEVLGSSTLWDVLQGWVPR